MSSIELKGKMDTHIADLNWLGVTGTYGSIWFDLVQETCRGNPTELFLPNLKNLSN